MAELADAGDSKSPSLRGVRVQVPPRAPFIETPVSFQIGSTKVDRVGKKLLKSRLLDTSQQLKRLQADLQVAEEQLAVLVDEAEDARIRSLVSETPIADKEHREAHRHAESMRRHYADLQMEIMKIENLQNQLLDQISSNG